MNILMGMPIYHRVEPVTMVSTMTMIAEAREYGIGIDFTYITERSVDICRNIFAAQVAKSDVWTHLLLVDDDMGFTFHRLRRLIEKRVDMALAPGPRKAYPLTYALHHFGDSTPDEDGFMRIAKAGCCFALISKDLIRDLSDIYPHGTYYDPSGSQEVCQLFEKKFTEGGVYLEDSYSFCEKILDYGVNVWADMESDLVHVGRHSFQVPAENWAKHGPHIATPSGANSP